MSGFRVAIDGPAGSGKSTISSTIAQKLGWTHIDTGAMYRAVTLKAIELGIDLSDEAAYRFLETCHIHYERDRIYIDDRDVTKAIRSDKVTKNVSLVSTFPYVRNTLVRLQQTAAMTGNIIMDGRDIGTVVIPDAELKIFLTANVEERAKRRYAERVQKGKQGPMAQIIEEIVIRDQKDSTRRESPLRQAEDAIVMDTTHLTIEDVVKQIIACIEQKEKVHGD